ncbi:MAG TPA: hypothetical protein VHV30_11465 [Polyangiaceae bacterium]|jgi:hypothetical protein|nr:hypothetical protein [Polyangiaceae bacterium]
MDVINFRVRHPAGKVDVLVTEAAKVLIGAGSHCEIRLPVGAARVEHVVIQMTPAGWRASARSFDPAPKLDGVEFTEAPILGPCVITIDETRIEVAPSTGPGDSAASVKQVKAKRNIRVYLYLALGLAAWLALYSARPKGRTTAAEPALPALWPAETTERCPQIAPEPALAAANARLDMAVAKEERSPFHPEDGLSAVGFYRAAEACYRAAGHDADADQVVAAGERLRQSMSEQFREHRLRLKRALAVEEWDIAVHESGILIAFLQSTPGDYVTWLSNTRRKLQIQYGGKAKK